MTYREWFALIAIIVGLLSGFAGVIRAMFTNWMRGREAAEAQIHRDIQSVRNEFHSSLLDRTGCQARHDRELADLRLEIVKNYPRREELTASMERLTLRIETMTAKVDDLKEIVLRNIREE